MMKKVLLFCTAVQISVLLPAQETVSFEQLFSTGNMTPYINRIVSLPVSDTLYLNGYTTNNCTDMYVSDHRVQNDCEQGNNPRAVYAFTLYDNDYTPGFKRLGTKLANVTMKVTGANTAVVQRAMTYIDHERPARHGDIGNYGLKICGFNVENFYIVTKTSGEDATKKSKVIAALQDINADIFALCEMEEEPTAMQALATALNEAWGSNVYAAVQDNITTTSTYTRSGFIYKTSAVEPYGGFSETSTNSIYKKRNIAQGFRDLDTGETFVLGMNHFKAKDTSDDEGEATRLTNANHLVNFLKTAPSKYSDNDILLMGDFNSCTGEEPLQIIQNADYTDLLAIYEPGTYSKVFDYTTELLDHAFASATMLDYVTGATVYHINADERPARKYDAGTIWRSADHDPVIVGLRFGEGSNEGGEETTCQDLNVNYTFESSLAPFVAQSVTGSQNWLCDSYGYAKMSGYSNSANYANEDWLVSAAYDLSGYQTATLTFNHAINYDRNNRKADYQTLWLTNDYTGDVQTTTWEQLDIPTYPSGSNWTFVNSGNISVPEQYLTENTRFAFKYVSTDTESAATWEIDNVKLTAICKRTALPTTHSQQTSVHVSGRIMTVGGAAGMYVSVYDLLGRSVVLSEAITENYQLEMPSQGLYVVYLRDANGYTETHKVIVP